MAIGNAINEQTTGICGFTGTAFTGTAVTNHAVIIGGATSSTLSNVGPTSTAGQVLQSAGASANPSFSTPTYPSASGATGKILRSDGTNNLYTTATFPDTAGTSGNVLTSDGTNWNSSAPPGGGLLSVSGIMTSLQIKAARASPLQIIAAPGAGKTVFIVGATLKYVYGGTNVFVAGAGQTIALAFGTATTGWQGASTNTSIANSALVGTTSNVVSQGSSQSAGQTGFVNVAVNLYNPVATEITGNAANNNTIEYTVVYFIQ